jgi:hypothetical protein
MTRIPKRRMTNGDKPSVKHEPIVGSKKRGCVFDSYYDLFIFKQKPIPYSFLERLSEDLMNWSTIDTSLRIEDFWMDRGIRQMDYYRFLERCEELKEAHDIALIRIATRRDKGALTRKFDSSWAARTQAGFDETYRRARKFEAELTKDIQDHGPKLVVIERMPNTIEVKDKKDE